MKRAVVYLGGLSIAAALVACASDPNKNANDAHDAQLAAQARQQSNAADAEKDREVTAAKTEQNSTDSAASHSDRVTKTAADADAKMVYARQVASAKAIDRLYKADAKTDQLRSLINHAGGRATTQSRDALQAVDQQRVQAKQACDALANSTDDQYLTAKQTADTQLDVLEGYVKQASSEVDKFK